MQEGKERHERAAADAALQEAALATEAHIAQAARAAAVATATSARAAAVAAVAAGAAPADRPMMPWADDASDSFRAGKLAEVDKAPMDLVSSDKDFESQVLGPKRSRSSAQADSPADKEGQPKPASQVPKKKVKVGSFAKSAAARAKARGVQAALKLLAAAKRNPQVRDPERDLNVLELVQV